YAWGTGDKEPYVEAAYEVRVIDGVQHFRNYPDGKKALTDVPFHFFRGGTVVPAAEWSTAPKMVGMDLRLKVRQAPDVVMNERRGKVFQDYASVGGKVCPFNHSEYYVFV